MRCAKGSFKEPRLDVFGRFAVVMLLLAGVGAIPSTGQQKGQKTFSSAEESGKALYNAAKASDEKALVEILGLKGRKLISSGDAAEDAENRASFAKRYEEMNRLVREPDGSVTLYGGPYNWPFPIPLANKGGVWYFDTEGGEKEILFRRIGRNEISAMHICQQLVATQKDYYAQHHEYAQKVFSSEGKQDGLYWRTEGGATASPIGPRLAWAFINEAGGQTGGPATPYRGYYFEMLSSQGKEAMGGAKSDVSDEQNDRRLRVRGVSCGVPFVGREHLCCGRGRCLVREGSGEEDRNDRQVHERVEYRLVLAKIGGSAATGCQRTTKQLTPKFAHVSSAAAWVAEELLAIVINPSMVGPRK